MILASPTSPEQAFTPHAPHQNRPIDLSGFVVFDLETTGLSPRWHEIIQIAALRLDASGKAVDSFATYARPTRPIPAHITTLTGISDADVADAPTTANALQAFARFVSDGKAANTETTLVAHNGRRFDLRFIVAACERHSLATRPTPFLDTLLLSRRFWPAEPLHNLDVILQRLDIQPDSQAHPRHDARADVHLLAKAFSQLLSHRDFPGSFNDSRLYCDFIAHPGE